jgi:hypothetical protein
VPNKKNFRQATESSEEFEGYRIGLLDRFARKQTTKILAVVDALSNLVQFVLLPINRHGTVSFVQLIQGSTIDALVSDKAFNSKWITPRPKDFASPNRLPGSGRDERARSNHLHLPAIAANGTAKDRLRNVRMAKLGRELLPGSETLPPHRPARKQNRQRLQGNH